MVFSPFATIPQALCPVCLHSFDERLAPHESESHHPRPGDLTACPDCASLLILATDLTPQRSTREQVSEAPPEVIRQLQLEQAKIFGKKALARAAGVGLN